MLGVLYGLSIALNALYVGLSNNLWVGFWVYLPQEASFWVPSLASVWSRDL